MFNHNPMLLISNLNSTLHRNLLINQSISEGNDPVRIVCAYGVDSQHTPCLIQALK